MLRKVLVNDLVHSFCYCCRNQTVEYPFVLTQGFHKPPALIEFPAPLLAPFAIYALAKFKNYVLAMRVIILLASNLRSLSTEEQAYATQLMDKYYARTESFCS